MERLVHLAAAAGADAVVDASTFGMKRGGDADGRLVESS